MTKDREARIAKVRAWKLRKHNLRVLTSDNPQAAISAIMKQTKESA